jgi:hypothetical protein
MKFHDSNCYWSNRRMYSNARSMIEIEQKDANQSKRMNTYIVWENRRIMINYTRLQDPLSNNIRSLKQDNAGHNVVKSDGE